MRIAANQSDVLILRLPRAKSQLRQLPVADYQSSVSDT
jgi:hypothetical protein